MLSLFHRPGTIVFLDDDADYLEMLALVAPRHWHVKLLTREHDCIDSLRNESARWEADAWAQQQLVDAWRQGKPLIGQVLDYWSTCVDRHALTRVCVCDYSMPQMDGLQVLGALGAWPGTRVLLTGQADEQIAIDAFNRKLIDQFIPKQTPDLSRQLVNAVEQLLATPHPWHAQTWRATLKPEQDRLLRESSVADALSALAAKLWVEHVVIGEPFGILGLSRAGQASWLQLETPTGLGALAELLEVEGLPASQVQEVRAGRALASPELQQSLGGGPACELQPSFTIGSRGQLLGALFPIAPEQGPRAASSYDHWFSKQPRRAVRA